MAIGISITLPLGSSFGKGADETLPEFLSAEIGNVSDTALIIRMSELINSNVVPANNDFTVTDGAANAVTNVSINGIRITLTLTNPIDIGDTVTVAYTKGGNALQDLSGNEADSWVAQSVTNNVGIYMRDSYGNIVYDSYGNPIVVPH